MPRRRRPQVAGGLYHVTMRGNNRGEIFVSDEDRAMLIDAIGRAKRRHGWKVHAYCLMSNHYHLLIETPEPNIAIGMQWLNSTYAHRFNEKYERIGHLFQRRYADGIILTDEHLHEVIRYIPLNPVRAGLCKRPEDWPWSNCRATLGYGPREPFLSVRPTLDRFSPDPNEARALLHLCTDCNAPRRERNDGVAESRCGDVTAVQRVLRRCPAPLYHPPHSGDRLLPALRSDIGRVARPPAR